MLLLGSVLLVVGIAALVLPGPGLLLILAGLVVLASEYEWAARRVDWMREKALGAAEYGVQTVIRIMLSALGAVAVMASGVFWGLDPQIPEVWVIGPELPFGGWGVGASMIVGGAIAAVLLGYSIKRFRIDGDTAPNREEVRSERAER